MALLHKMAACAFCGFAMKKVMVAMLSPSSMVVVWWRKRWIEAIFSPFFVFFYGVFGLVHYNEMVVLFFWLKVVMARGRRLRKSGGGELEVDKQNFVT
jgi:hypothetical protein